MRESSLICSVGLGLIALVHNGCGNANPDAHRYPTGRHRLRGVRHDRQRRAIRDRDGDPRRSRPGDIDLRRLRLPVQVRSRSDRIFTSPIAGRETTTPWNGSAPKTPGSCVHPNCTPRWPRIRRRSKPAATPKRRPGSERAPFTTSTSPRHSSGARRKWRVMDLTIPALHRPAPPVAGIRL